MPLDAGTVIAGYTVEGVLGAGGMGTVYRARHPSLPRSDALKVLSAELSSDDMFRARFQREADLAASLDHPNIVTIFNRGETPDGKLWIAMQFIDGSDADREVREGRMTARRAVKIIGAVADALDYAHRRNILHRDVKPANFLLAANDHRILLADFGIARAVDEAVGLTQTGLVMASVAYAAPETLSGAGVDHRADIYALGCSLFRLMVGKTPFAKPEGGMAATAAAHLTEAPPRATAYLPGLPPAVDAVFQTALAKDPNQRYQTARQLADAAAAALDGNSTQAWAPTDRGAGRQPSGGNRVPTHAPAGEWVSPTSRHLAEAATQPGTPWHPPGVPPPPDPRVTRPGGSRARRRAVIIGSSVTALVAVIAVVLGLTVFSGGSTSPAYSPQTFTHVHGTTTLNARPRAVAALGPGDGAAVLALGVQPVAVGSPGAKLPSWQQSALTSQASVLSGFTDTAAVAAAKPDVIIATGDLDDATYTKLAAIAPTITRPTTADAGQWTWQDQQKWVGRILGESDKATALIGEVASAQDDLRNQNKAFTGKTVDAVTVSDAGTAAVLTPTFTSTYLASLGFSYAPGRQREPTDAADTRPLTDVEIGKIEADVLLIIRTDSRAGGGGFGALPIGLTIYQGIPVIIDEPDLIAALQNPGGYLATRYLDSTLVPQLGQLVR